jgi:hypothetical protein
MTVTGNEVPAIRHVYMCVLLLESADHQAYAPPGSPVISLVMSRDRLFTHTHTHGRENHAAAFSVVALCCLCEYKRQQLSSFVSTVLPARTDGEESARVPVELILGQKK